MVSLRPKSFGSASARNMNSLPHILTSKQDYLGVRTQAGLLAGEDTGSIFNRKLSVSKDFEPNFDRVA